MATKKSPSADDGVEVAGEPFPRARSAAAALGLSSADRPAAPDGAEAGAEVRAEVRAEVSAEAFPRASSAALALGLAGDGATRPPAQECADNGATAQARGRRGSAPSGSEASAKMAAHVERMKAKKEAAKKKRAF